LARQVNYRRRVTLLDAAVDHATQHGFAELTWRSVAAALGEPVSSLVYYFRGKEEMLEAVLVRLRERDFAATSRALGKQQPGLEAAARAIWMRACNPRRLAERRLFFAGYGRALQAPRQFRHFLDGIVADWVSVLVDAQSPGTDQETAARRATLVIATIHGLLLDLLATGDRRRVYDAAESFFVSLGRQTRRSGHTRWRWVVRPEDQ
jgi:AcrR family transcriptional regulator